MKIKNMIYPAVAGLSLALLATGCSLDYDPLDTYSDVTEGVDDSKEGEEVVFKDRASVESAMTALYKKITDQQEHWYLDQPTWVPPAPRWFPTKTTPSRVPTP